MFFPTFKYDSLLAGWCVVELTDTLLVPLLINNPLKKNMFFYWSANKDQN